MMNCRARRLVSSLTLASLLLAGNFSSGQSQQAQEAQKPKEHFLSMFPNSRMLDGCQPVEVKSVGNYAPPPTGQEVVIKSFSLKPVVAIKLGWYVFEDANAWSKIIRLPCNSSLPEKVILSGQTSWIELGHIYQGQTCAIGKSPLRFRYPNETNILLDSAPFKMDDFKALTLDGTVNTFKQDYSAMIVVGEIRYDDGSTWKAKIEAPK